MDAKRFAPLTVFLLLLPGVHPIFERFNREVWGALGRTADIFTEYPIATIVLLAFLIAIWLRR